MKKFYVFLLSAAWMTVISLTPIMAIATDSMDCTSNPAKYPIVMRAEPSANGTARALVPNRGTGLDVPPISIYYSADTLGGSTRLAGTSLAVPQTTDTIERIERTSYSFSGYGKAPSTETHAGIVVDCTGWVDLRVTKIDRGTTITVSIVNAYSKDTVHSDTFTSVGGTQFLAEEGSYSLVVAITEGEGICEYSMNLLTPEETYENLTDDEVPLAWQDNNRGDRPQAGGVVRMFVMIGVPLACMSAVTWYTARRKNKEV